jgi:outer membrane protein OmpA-like peptidoglycan-associated protein
MSTYRSYAATAAADTPRGRSAVAAAGRLAALSLLAVLAGCTPPPATVAAAPPPLPPAPVPFDQAVANAANNLFKAAPQDAAQRVVVIDPLVNGVTGEQSVATQTIQSEITALAKQRYPQFKIAPFTARTAAETPYVLVGTFTPVNAQNQPTGDREAFRFCLVMADMASGKIVAKSVTRALPQSVNASPVAFFRDSPAWVDDPSVKSYIATCQATKVGDTIPPAYVSGLVTAAIVADAIDAYDAGKYRNALELYRNAETTPAGKQLRVLNGVYLTEARLGRKNDSAAAFGNVVDSGLATNRLAVKMLFKPGSTAFLTTAPLASDYPMWLREIAAKSADRNACLNVVGNTSKTGSAELNDQLSLARANFVKARLETDQAALKGRLNAVGAGDKAVLIGTGADDATDALDRRVEFQPGTTCG